MDTPSSSELLDHLGTAGPELDVGTITLDAQILQHTSACIDRHVIAFVLVQAHGALHKIEDRAWNVRAERRERRQENRRTRMRNKCHNAEKYATTLSGRDKYK